MNIFNFINESFQKKRELKSSSNLLDENESVFMLSRWGSMIPFSFKASFITSSKSSKLPKWATTLLFFHTVKKRKFFPTFNNYIKKEKGKSEVSDELMEKITNHFHCSKFHAEQIYKIYKKKHIDLYISFGVKNK